MRIVKESEERREEILDAAESLFAAKGYTSTSTNDIIDKVGIARGTLYYHFKSKEEILDAVVLRFTDSLINKAEAISLDKSIDLIDRIVLTMTSLSSDTELGKELLSEIHKNENALLHQKVQDRMLSRVVKIFERMIEEGNAIGYFNCQYPYETSDMIITYSYIAFDNDKMESNINKERLITGFIRNVEKLLSIEEGSMEKFFCLKMKYQS